MPKNVLVVCSTNEMQLDDNALDNYVEYIREQYKFPQRERNSILQFTNDTMTDEEIKQQIVLISRTDFQSNIELLHYFFPEFTGTILKYGNISDTNELEFEFCDARKDDGSDSFPTCMMNNSKQYDMVWFCGCSLITFLFSDLSDSNKNLEIIMSLFSHLTENGIIIFTDDDNDKSIPIKNFMSNNINLSDENALNFLKLWNYHFTIKRSSDYFYYMKNKNKNKKGGMKLKYKKRTNKKRKNNKRKNSNKQKQIYN